MSDYPETPELDKLSGVKDQSQPIGEFLDWLSYEKDVRLPASIEQLLADYFDIDMDKVEAEKLAILKHVRAKQDG